MRFSSPGPEAPEDWGENKTNRKVHSLVCCPYIILYKRTEIYTSRNICKVMACQFSSLLRQSNKAVANLLNHKCFK